MTKTIPELGNAGSSSVTGTDGATGDTLVGRTADGDTTLRRVTVGGTGGGLVNTGFLKAGVLAFTTSQTVDENTVNQTFFAGDATSGALLDNLPAASASVGRLHFCYKSDSGTNTVTITRAGSDTIDNALTTLVLRKQNEGYLIYCDTTSHWKIIAYFPGNLGSEQTTIPDPGSSGAIAVTHSGCVDLVSGGAETRTMSGPTFRGQRISLGGKTVAGNITLTIASTVNSTGNNTLVFDTAGDNITLHAVNVSGTLKWRVLVNDSVTLSTV